MAKKPGTNPKGEFVFFDVVYEDGSQRSNRRVPAELLGGLTKDEPARGFIIEQDREIAAKSGRAPLKIKSTPGADRALATSMDLIRACACGERTTKPWASPAGAKSSV